MSRDAAQLALVAAGSSFQHLTEVVDRGGPHGERLWLAESVMEALRIYVAELRATMPAEVPRG